MFEEMLSVEERIAIVSGKLNGKIKEEGGGPVGPAKIQKTATKKSLWWRISRGQNPRLMDLKHNNMTTRQKESLLSGDCYWIM
ncbi:hypothetical protein TNCV_2394401 [Trichonephila clavipes]|nr:hypothetical protein TNCV_2394401 [Trichonephila clavipes]